MLLCGVLKMKNLSHLIKGLQIIEKNEKENPDIQFNSQNGYLYIGELTEYTEKQIEELEQLNFNLNYEYDCFEYNLD